MAAGSSAPELVTAFLGKHLTTLLNKVHDNIVFFGDCGFSSYRCLHFHLSFTLVRFLKLKCCFFFVVSV